MNLDRDDAPSAAAPKLSRFHLLLGRVETSFNLVAALFIFGLMLLGVAQVLGRRLFHAPIPGYIDFVEISIASFAFLGIAYCQRVGGHVRMELFLKMAKGRWHYAMEIAGTLVGLFIIGVLVWYGFEHFLRAYQLGDSTIDAELPIWPSKLVVPVSFALLWLRLLVQLAGYMRLWLDPQAESVAVPRVLTAEDLATQEVEDSARRG
ncbi:MAG: TRAP transporter small permease [Burkholderiales bacterium]|nr:TRAP transporter small permease [Burkholderiales bacterium]